jgi:addiction module HigA family antidote
MPKSEQTPGSVLHSFIDEYQINPFYLSKEINLSYQTILNILKGVGKITVPTALRLAKYFDNSPSFWLDVQIAYEINQLSDNKRFISMIKKIPKAKKNAGKAKSKKKPGYRKVKALSQKRKKAAKSPGSKAVRGRRAGRPRRK